MLIDAGNAENGGDIVRDIRAAGYDTVDFLVATHPHADHIGGMAEVVNEFERWINIYAKGYRTIQRLILTC